MFSKKHSVLALALLVSGPLLGMDGAASGESSKEGLDRAMSKRYILEINNGFEQLLSNSEFQRVFASTSSVSMGALSGRFSASLLAISHMAAHATIVPMLVAPATIDKFSGITQIIRDNLERLSTSIAGQLPEHDMLTHHRLLKIIQALINSVKVKLTAATAPLNSNRELAPFVSDIKIAYKLTCDIFERLSHFNTSSSLLDQTIESGVSVAETVTKSVKQEDDSFHLSALLGALLDTGTRIKTTVDEKSMEGCTDSVLLELLDRYTVSSTPSSSEPAASSASSSAGPNNPVDIASAVGFGVEYGKMATENWPSARGAAKGLRDSDFNAYENSLLMPITAPTTTGAASYLMSMASPVTSMVCSSATTNKTLAIAAYLNGVKATRGYLADLKICSGDKFDKTMTRWVHTAVQKGTEVLKSKTLERVCDMGDTACTGIEKGTPWAEKFAVLAKKTKSETDTFLGFLHDLGCVGVSNPKR